MAGYRQSFAPDRCAKRAEARIPAASSGEGPPALVAAAIGGGDGSDLHRCWDAEHHVHDIAQPANVKPGDQICGRRVLQPSMRHLEHLRFDEVTCSLVVASVTLLQPALATSVPDNQQGLISTSVESVSRLYSHATVRRSPLSLRFWLPRIGHSRDLGGASECECVPSRAIPPRKRARRSLH